MSAIARLRADPALAALRRSLDVYYGDAARDAAMDRLYARFLAPGDLAFDIGSHVGDRIGSFRRLGCRVVALEPQPDCARVVRGLYGDDPGVTLIEAACGPVTGRLALQVNSANPTVTTASQDFVRSAAGQAGWEGQVWDRTIEVPVTTLDTLIGEHGMPAFVKIDVEGFEADVLAGLSHEVPALSFEFTTIQRDVAYRCLQRLEQISLAEGDGGSGKVGAVPYRGAPQPRPLPGRGRGGPVGRGDGYRFNVALGESQRLMLPDWVSGEEMAAHIRALPHEANSGDVYAIATVAG